MTDYRLKTEKSKSSDRKDKFLTAKSKNSFNETRQGLVSKEQESDGLVKKTRELTNKYRADVIVKDPGTFAFFGSAKKYYEDAFDNIINYYPYDGSKKEILEWYETASPVEIGLLHNHWPSYVGNVSINSQKYISFYSGPQSISESEYLGNYIRGETGLKLNPTKGNTVEFWLKKDNWSAPEEIIFDIGSYPGKVPTANSGQFRLFLSNSSGSPFHVDYKIGTTGISATNIGSSNLTTNSVGDDAWHHYALRVHQEDSKLHMKLYVDGGFDSLTTASVSTMGSLDTYMGGRIGASQADTTGSLSGSIDDFRFWKGKRTSKQISRFFDQKVFASENLDEDYETKLGLYYRFNKPAVGKNETDKLVLDSSGNDITGVIQLYDSTVRVAESAIILSAYTSNSEIEDASLDDENSAVLTLKEELLNIGEAHDLNNASSLKNFVPEWVFDNNNNGLSNPDSHIATLFHIMASEFDQIRQTIDAVKLEKLPRYESITQEITKFEDGTSLQMSSSYMPNNFFIGCDDSGKIYAPSLGAHAEFSLLKCEQAGLTVVERPLLNVEPNDEQDLKVAQTTVTKPFEEIRRAILENVYSSAKYMLKRKGGITAFDAPIRAYGVDTDLVSFNIYGNNTDTFLTNENLDIATEEKNSVFFGENIDSTIFLTASDNEERTYLQGDTEETEYTFEGTFIFPVFTGDEHDLKSSSIFGISEVSATNNDLTAPATNNADFVVKVVKNSTSKNDAKFVLISDSGIISDIESSVFKDVYDNSRWNIALKIVKDLDNKFVSSSAASYKVELTGHNHILDTLQNSFNITSSLTLAQYQNFKAAHKTVFIGAQRTNITGSVISKTDVKVIDFNGWNDDISTDELKIRSMSPSTTGRDKSNTYKENYNTINKLKVENKIFSIQFDATPTLSSENNLTIIDATSGSVDQVIKYGQLIGNKYQAKSTAFTKNLANVIQREFLPVVRNIPVGNLHGDQGTKIKASEINKFDLSSRPEAKLLSFEKSMYQAVSREMVNFVGGILSFNNLIGDPINKYRKNYKMLEHLRQQFFETVESENQFERFVSYFRWIDRSVGHFIEQLVPATVASNTGIEEVVESHALERNKYDHKAPIFERKEPNLETNLLAINELLYDWEHGHHSDSENDHCLWQKDRKERTGDRETLRKVLTTKVEGSTYVTRNLVRPYRHTIDRQTLLNIGSNRNANKNRDLYKIINEGKEISILSDDIYEFKQCNDVLNPQEEKLYSAKTNTTTTDGYLDADADMILPFSLYSSSVGTDFENFKQNLKITNNHDGIPALQSPFVRDLVGGMPHRSVKIGTPGKDRPEAYDISSSADSFVVKQTTGPKSMFHRDLGGARFYHIGNVKTTETPLVIGNYSKDYEIVMTNGRSLNNNYLVENEGTNLTGSLVSSEFVSGSTDFYVPPRPARDHVIVNRFAAPGGPETAGAYGLDRAAAEYSIYNTINYRNPIVREVENILSTERSEKFGYRSGSMTQASRHMTNRNPRKFTGSLEQELTFDNNFVQHEIPQNDFGYSWVTASANESVYSFLNKNENTGHQHLMNISGTLKSSQTIAFVSASEIGTGFFPTLENAYGAERDAYNAGTFMPVDFVNLNTIVLEPLSADTNTLGTDQAFTQTSNDFFNNLINNDIGGRGEIINSIRFINGFFGDVTTLNSVILNRQGPYGWPSWKQIKGGEHPVARNHRKNNKLSVMYRENSGKKYAFVDSIKGDYEFDFKETVDISDTNTSARIIQNYDEMYITSKFNPLNVNLTRYNNTSITLENLDVTIQAAIGIAFVAVNQSAQHHMWVNDEYYLSAITRDASRLNSGLSIDDDDKFAMFGPTGALSEEEQQMVSDALFGLRESAAASMRASVHNKITGFAQRKFENLIISDVQNSELWSKYIDSDKYVSDASLAVLKNFLVDGITNQTMRELNYIETVYPREINTYKGKVRFRDNFHFFGWDSARSNRELIMSGNVSYDNAAVSFTADGNVKMFFPATQLEPESEFEKAFHSTIDIVDVNSTGSDASIASSTHITASSWVLDSRQTLTSLPLNITSSYFTEGDSFVRTRTQGTRGEGILQNDYSIFGLGYNGLRGAPPMSTVYNRRIPQDHGNNAYLAGEAKWEAAKDRTGPFYDTYQDYAEGLRNVGQTYSLIPEFRIHEVIEDYLTTGDSSKYAIDEFLQLTGTVYHTSSGDLSVGTQFFETYSMTDFMKYFQVIKDDLEDNDLGLVPGKLTLRCQAVKRFLPYRGFYPAERVVQLSEIFDRCYLRPESYGSKYLLNDSIKEAPAKKFLDLRIQNSKAQALKPLMAPGVLLNSIKTGLAVDYPIFSSSLGNAIEHIFSNNITSSLDDFSELSLGSTTSFTGSLINSSIDEGIPRITGSLEYRVSFDDLLYPGRIYDKIVYDNEPHPSASMLYGSADHLKVLDRPPRFGNIDRDMSIRYGAMDFETSRSAFKRSMLPYQLATHNFCAETVNFFLEDGVLNTAISAPGSQFFENSTYKMRVYITNDDTTMYDRHSAFGPPVDEGDPEVTRYEFRDTTVQGVAASGSVQFDKNNGIDQDIVGKTVTIPIDSTPSNNTVYEFVRDVTATAATASLEFSGISDPHGTLSGSTISLEDSSGTSKTFQFCPTNPATTASFEINIGGESTLDHVLFAVPEITASNFAVSRSYDGSPLDPNYPDKLGRHFIPVGNQPKLPLITFESPVSNIDHNVHFYDPDTLFAGRTVIQFVDPVAGYNASVFAGLGAHTGISQNAKLQFYVTDGYDIQHQYTFNLYDHHTASDNSALTDVIINDVSSSTDGPNSTTAYITTAYDTSGAGATEVSNSNVGSFLKPSAVLVQDVHDTLANHFFTGALADQFVMATSSEHGVTSQLAIFSKRFRPAAGADESRDPLPHLFVSGSTNLFLNLGPSDPHRAAHQGAAASMFRELGSGVKAFAFISTGSQGQSSFPHELGSFDAYHKFYPDAVPIYNNTTPADPNFNKTIIGSATSSFGSTRTRYVSLRTLPSHDAIGALGTFGGLYTPTGSIIGPSSVNIDHDVAADLADRIFDMGGDQNITSSVDNDIVTVHSTVTGVNTSAVLTTVAGWQTRQSLPGSFELMDLNSNIASVDSAFAGGSAAVSFTNGATLANNGNTIIVVGPGATTTDVAMSGNAVFGSGLDITAGRTNTTIALTQDTVGSAGNKTIGQSGFVSDGGSINGGSNSTFGGGVNAVSHTTGQAIGGGNSNIAVIVGTENSGGTFGNTVYVDTLDASSRFKDAISTVQGSTFTVVNNDDGDGGSRTVVITHKVEGAHGNNAMSDNDSGNDYFDNDVLGFAGGVDFVQGTVELAPTAAIQSSSHGFLPYVAPFLDPNTSPYAELSFTPSRAGEYTIPEVLTDLEITYYNMPAPSNAADNLNYNAAMVLSASIDFRSAIKLRGDHTDSLITGKSSVNPNIVDLSRWVIRPKWETPVIDFSDVTSSAVNLSNNSEQQVSGSPWKTRYQSSYYDILKTSDVPYLTGSTGMWHQSGNLLERLSDKGYHMVIEAGDLGIADKYEAKDLATKVGFLDGAENSRKIRLGQVATNKTVWEAVVAIPFYNDPEDGVKFFDLDPDVLRAGAAINRNALLGHTTRLADNTTDPVSRKAFTTIYDNFYNTPGTNGPENVAYQLRMMEKFILPPQFDFLSKSPICADVEPFVQYIFQFNGKLTDNDLASLWQNLYPNSEVGPGQAKHSSPFPESGTRDGLSLEYPDVEYISNFLDTDSVGMFQTMTSNYENVSEFLENEVRWLVFKAKQRAISNYDDMVIKSVTQNNIANILEIDGREVDLLKINENKSNPQFNWPYDYFSLVELGKLESKVDFYDDARRVGIPKETGRRPEKESGFQTTQRRQTQASSGDVAQFAVVDIGVPTASSTVSSVADSMVFKEVLLADTTTPSTRTFNITGGTISSGTEQLFVNGVLQSLGSGNDYTISGNTVTFTYDLDAGDSVVISYVKS